MTQTQGISERYAFCGKEACMDLALRRYVGQTIRIEVRINDRNYRCECMANAKWCIVVKGNKD